jgi:hypothetical protein
VSSPAGPDDALERALRELRAEYLAEATQRAAELWSALARVQNGDAGGLDALRMRVHRLAGSGGGYGFAEITRTAQDADAFCREVIARGGAPSAADLARLQQLIQGVAGALDRAQAPE